MASGIIRRTTRAAAVFGATLAAAFCGFTGPAHAVPVPDAAYFQVRPLHSDKCLDVANISFEHGADVLQADCWNGWNQQWRLEQLPGTWYFQIKPRHSGKCLDVAYASKEHGANVIQGDCWGGWNQAWGFFEDHYGIPQQVARPEVGKYYQIRARHSGKCLDVAYMSKDHGADVIQGDCWNGANQLWRFVPAPQ
ncbi:RICIN domain-containing protein [Streptomyces sp. NPDC051909]|uniref:RICIN domain-containing protein n=1 Tax=Streptomyces sp. NPDC051909 TaxID=3154944 RepID=UPI003428B3C4